MKKLLFIVALMISLTGYAQSNKEDIDLIQSIYGKEKKTIVAEFIKLEGTQGDAFWKLYDEYETERKKLGHQRVALLEKYASSYATLDDATTDDLMKQMLDLGTKNDKLQKTYYDKIRKSVGSKPAAQFVQLEAYLLSVIRATIFESIPLIGELK